MRLAAAKEIHFAANLMINAVGRPGGAAGWGRLTDSGPGS